MKTRSPFLLPLSCTALALLLAPFSQAQFFDPATEVPVRSGTPEDGAKSGDKSKKEEKQKFEMPSFDPGSEIMSFNGKLWNVTNNRLFRARFEKYLAAPESPAAEDAAYRKVIDDILAAIAPTRSGGPDLPRAVSLLPIAAQSPIDAKLSDALANAIYTVWVSRKNSAELTKADAANQKALSDLNRNADLVNPAPKLPSARSLVNGTSSTKMPTVGVAADYVRRIAELDALRAAAATRRELTELESKLQYQSLVVQFFLQRRFEHVVMSCRIYRVLFGAVDQTIVLDKNSAASKSLSQGTGQSPTISMLDAMANEAIRDVDEGVKAFSYLISQNDLDSASNRLAEAFATGEYLARIRTLPRKEKQPVVGFVRDSNQLVGAMEVRDFRTAQALITKMKGTAGDFDGIKAQSKIEEATIASNLLIDKAKMSSLQGKAEDAAADLEKARSIWPTNPALAEFHGVFERGGLQATSLKEMETLLNQKNYRAILADQARFSAAVSGIPDLEKKLADVLAKVRQLDIAVTQSDQLAEAGDPHGAWEVMHKASLEAPADSEINRRLAALAGRASDLASSVGKAQRYEKTGELGPALTWYLKARSTYPLSQLAKEGIDRMSGSIMKQSEPLPPVLSTPPTGPGTGPGPAAASTPIATSLPAAKS